MLVRKLWLCLLVAILAGCGQPSSRYQLTQDMGPGGVVDLSHVEEPVPALTSPGRRGNKSPYTVLGNSYEVMASGRGYVEEGVASWYGKKFHGYQTSNGEIYNMYRFTAAHKSLPLPIYARVTNQANGRQVIVRINDRGPFHGGRLIDLSYAAAKKLGFLANGTAHVKVETYPFADTVLSEQRLAGQPASGPTGQQVGGQGEQYTGATHSGSVYFLQVGAFANESAARRTVRQLDTLVDAPVFLQAVDGGSIHRVRIGPFEQYQTATQVQRTLKSGSYPDTVLLSKP